MQNQVRITDQHVLFWNGWPSQWFAAFFVIEGVPYNCAEQYMMAEKARVFGDEDALAAILRTDSPREQKALGREVRGFDPDAWDRICRGIVYVANLEKFSQNAPLRKLLLNTGDRTIVEASPKDRIWGIGLGQDDPKATDESQWRGSNWLGIALMQVRATLISQASGSPAIVEGWLQEQLDRRKAFA